MAKLGEVFIAVGFQGQDESICVVCVSRKGIEPTHDPSAKGEGVVNPVLRIIVFFFAWNRCAP